jgi:hypothetical protein
VGKKEAKIEHVKREDEAIDRCRKGAGLGRSWAGELARLKQSDDGIGVWQGRAGHVRTAIQGMIANANEFECCTCMHKPCKSTLVR